MKSFIAELFISMLNKHVGLYAIGKGLYGMIYCIESVSDKTMMK